MKGLCTYTMVAMRGETSECAELVNQMLFGETYEIVETRQKWAHIRLEHDNYDGWIDAKLVQSVSDEEYDRWVGGHKIVVGTAGATAKKQKEGTTQRVVPGSILSFATPQDNCMTANNETFKLADNLKQEAKLTLTELAEAFLNAPYLWGGRTPMGIDCSGFTQIVYRLSGHYLPRNASNQAKMGEEVTFENRKEGDLAFFSNDKGKITHVGMCTSNGFIHASGYVKRAILTHQGAYDINFDTSTDLHKEPTRQTHRLAFIKRILP